MKHQNPNEMEVSAEALPQGSMTSRERLERWADLLERHRGPLVALREIEYLPARERKALRGDDTPLAVAYNDPILRADGLDSDRFGEVMTFFDLSDHEAHQLFCDCHYHGTMTGTGLAARLRDRARTGKPRTVWERAQSIIGGL